MRSTNEIAKYKQMARMPVKKRLSLEVKNHIVKMVLVGASSQVDLAAEYNISQTTISKWVSERKKPGYEWDFPIVNN